ncbi:unnamed protein product, partial [Symbiodinium natans]
MADQALTKAWGTLSMEAKKAIEEAGWKPRTMEPGPIWPPGLPGNGSQAESMSQKEYHAAIETVWQGAEPAVQRLLRAAGIPPPGDYKPEDETPKQAIQATELEVAEAQKKVQACVKDEEDSPYKDVAAYLEKEGIILSEEQAEALKTRMAVKVVETDWLGQERRGRHLRAAPGPNSQNMKAGQVEESQWGDSDFSFDGGRKQCHGDIVWPQVHGEGSQAVYSTQVPNTNSTVEDSQESWSPVTRGPKSARAVDSSWAVTGPRYFSLGCADHEDECANSASQKAEGSQTQMGDPTAVRGDSLKTSQKAEEARLSASQSAEGHQRKQKPKKRKAHPKAPPKDLPQEWQMLCQVVGRYDASSEAAALEAIEKLEEQELNPLQQRACHEVLRSFVEQDAQYAKWILADVASGYRQDDKAECIKITAANITSWRKSIAAWIHELGPDLVVLQETHLKTEGIQQAMSHCQDMGYTFIGMPGSTKIKGVQGGLAVVAPRHRNLRYLTEYGSGPAGFLACAMRNKGWDLIIVSLYLESGVGFQAPNNIQVLARLIAFLKGCKVPYMVLGDWNEAQDTMRGTTLATEVGGAFVGVGEPTAQGSDEIDYGLVAKCLVPILQVKTDWETPFRPHAAMHWRVAQPCSSPDVPQMKKAGALVTETVEYEPVQNTQSINILDEPKMVDELSETFAHLSAGVERSITGRIDGMGVKSEIVRKKLVVNNPENVVWTGKRAAFWNRVQQWVKQGRHHGDAHPVARLVQRRLGEYYEGDAQNQEDMLVSILGRGTDARLVLKRIDEQQCYARKADMEETAHQYKQWLSKAMEKGMRPLYNALRKEEQVVQRPYMEYDMLERPHIRRDHWAAVWTTGQPLAKSASLMTELEDAAKKQAASVEPLNPVEVKARIKKLALKSPGPDGWRIDHLQAMDDKAVEAVVSFYHECEAKAAWPQQMTVSLIAMLPKNLTRERPIALLHILYRTWVRLRWDLVSTWQAGYATTATYDKAVPGSCCLDVAVGRLLRNEVAKTNGVHVVSLFVDLESFFDTIQFQQLIRAATALQYPPLILKMALEVYMGARYLVADGVLSAGIRATNGVQAGCPAAPSLAKVALHPVIDKIQRRRDVANVDCWLDDVSIDIQHKSFKQVADSAIRVYRSLKDGMDANGFTISSKKTGFVASSTQASKHLRELLLPHEPQVYDVMRDLGVDSTGGRKRRLVTSATRAKKAHARHSKLSRLGPPPSTKLRVVKAAITSVALWGHPSVGVSPKRMKWLRTVVGKHLGKYKLGSLETILDMGAKKCQDPKRTIHKQHFKVVAKVFRAWIGGGKAHFDLVWKTTWKRLSSSKHHWPLVAGPMAATMAYLMDLKVDASDPGKWKRGSVLNVDWTQPRMGSLAYKWLEGFLEEQKRAAIARQAGGAGAQEGLDWTPHHKLTKLGGLSPGLMEGIKSVWHAGVITESKPGCFAADAKVEAEGLIFATDASGGPGGIDPRVQTSALAVVAMSWTKGVLVEVGRITELVYPWQPVVDMERRALFRLMEHTEDLIDVTMDCKPAVQVLQKTQPPEDDLEWSKVWNDRKRIKATWVPSHKTEEEFLAKMGPGTLWRRAANDMADKVCGAVAAAAYSPAHKRRVKELDNVVRTLSLAYGARAAHILRKRKEEDFPFILDHAHYKEKMVVLEQYCVNQPEEQFLETDPKRANYTHLKAACRSLARCSTRNDWVYQAETYLSEERKNRPDKGKGKSKNKQKDQPRERSPLRQARHPEQPWDREEESASESPVGPVRLRERGEDSAASHQAEGVNEEQEASQPRTVTLAEGPGAHNMASQEAEGKEKKVRGALDEDMLWIGYGTLWAGWIGVLFDEAVEGYCHHYFYGSIIRRAELFNTWWQEHRHEAGVLRQSLFYLVAITSWLTMQGVALSDVTVSNVGRDPMSGSLPRAVFFDTAEWTTLQEERYKLSCGLVRLLEKYDEELLATIRGLVRTYDGKAWKKATYRERAWSSQRKKWQWPKEDATWWTRPAKNKEGMADQALTKAWGTLSMEAKKAIEEAGWKPRTMEPGPIWPPGLPGNGSQAESMSQKEYHAAIETVWQGAEPAVQRLLRAAGIPPPGDYKPEDETPKQAIQATELEVAEAQKKVQACVKDEEDSPYKDVAAYLEKEGIILSEEQAEALKTRMAVKVVETDWTGVLGPREPSMPVELGIYGPMRMSRDVSVRATPTGRERSPARAQGEVTKGSKSPRNGKRTQEHHLRIYHRSGKCCYQVVGRYDASSEAAALEAIEKLEEQELNPLQQRACHEVLRSFVEQDAQYAKWILADVVSGYRQDDKAECVKITSANITSWRKPIAAWIHELGPDLVVLQETHLKTEGIQQAMSHCQDMGYTFIGMPGSTKTKGVQGGLAVVAPRHRNLRYLTEYGTGPAGFLACAMRNKGWDLIIVSLYLESGVGFQAPNNIQVLARLIAFLKGCKVPYMVLGDWNEAQDTMRGTTLATEVGGAFVGVGEPTAQGSDEIDYGLVAKCLVPILQVKTDWETPFRPHAAMHWRVAQPCSSPDVPQMKKAGALVTETVEYEPVQNTQSINILDEPKMVDELSETFAHLSAGVERSITGRIDGMGVVKSEIVRKKLVVNNPENVVWTGKRAAFWNRVQQWVKQGRHHGDAHPVARLVQRRLGEYYEGDAQNQEDMLASILGRGTDARLVLKRIDEQQCYARKADMEETAHQYKQWLSKAMEKGMRPLYNALRKEEQVVHRPYMEYDMLERPHIRRDHWAAVWTTGQPLAKSASLMTELEDAAKNKRPAIKKLALKSPGPDGWRIDHLQAMDDKAAKAAWPQQMTVSLIAMLPKNLTRERPIALLHILYRTWVRLRWDLVSTWQAGYATTATYDKAVPGSCCLDVAVGRLLRNEVAKTNGVHVVSLFVDLESFFDTIQFQQLIMAATALQYPPLILKMALEVYMGARYLVADGVLSAGIRATNGVQAGCPAAPSLAKVALHPVIEKIQRRRDVANVDCWLDDVSIDIQHKSFKHVADSAIRVYRSLKDGMDANGFKISSKKTGFVASSTQASKHLRELLLPHEPQVYDVMRDLGVDSTGGRKRRLVTSATRAKKAHARHSKLSRLGPPPSTKLRVVKAAITSVALWGHPSVGVSPKRMKWLRTVVGKHLGKYKLGSLETILDMGAKKCQDPKRTIHKQHFKVVAKVFRAWIGGGKAHFDLAWKTTWKRLSAAKHHWPLVTGPMAATMAYLLDLKVDASDPGKWKRGSVLNVDWTQPRMGSLAYKWLEGFLEEQKRAAIARQAGGAGAQEGLDWTPHHKLTKLGGLSPGLMEGIKSVWHAGVITESKPGWCKKCQMPATLEHVLKECPYWREQGFKEPKLQEYLRHKYPWECLWTRALLPKPAVWHPKPPEHLLGLRYQGCFAADAKVEAEGLIFATDASGGPGGIDPRVQTSALAVVAMSWTNGVLGEAGRITELVYPWQPVVDMERRALFRLMEHTEDLIDVTMDCKPAVQVLQKTQPPEDDLEWSKVWNDRKRIKATWVPSHKTEEEFLAKMGPGTLWRRAANDMADKVCGAVAAAAYSPAHKRRVKELDNVVRTLSLAYGARAAHILRKRKEEDFPFILDHAHYKEKMEASQKAEGCKKEQGNAKLNKRQRLWQLLKDPERGHQWEKGSEHPRNLTLKCQLCGLYVQQTLTNLEVVLEQYCVNQPEARVREEWGIHPSHNMVNLGIRWVCTKCDRTHAPVSQKCNKSLAGECKSRTSQGKLVTQAQTLVNGGSMSNVQFQQPR